MKADRRHELKENELAHALESTRDYIDRNGKQISLVLLAIIVIFAAVTFGLRSRAAAVQDVWRQRHELKFDTLENGKKSIDQFDTLVEKAPDDTFAMSALLDQGREALRLSQLEPFPPGKELNERARTSFQKLLDRFKGNALAEGSALTGLATVEENAFSIDGDPAHKTRAREYLTKVTEGAQFSGLPLQRAARDRLANLDSIFVHVEVQPPLAQPTPEPEAPADDLPPPSP